MGESRGGEGSTERATTIQIAQTIARECASDGREVTEVHVSFVDKGLYAVRIEFLYEPEPESFFLYVDEDTGEGGSSTPFGGVDDSGSEE